MRFLAFIAAALTVTLAVASPAAAKSKKKSKSKKKKKADTTEVSQDEEAPTKKGAPKAFGVFASLGIESEKLKDTEDVEVSFGGFGASVQGIYNLALTPQLILPLSGGFNTVSMSGKSEGGDVTSTLTISITSLLLETGIGYLVTPQFYLGLLMSYDYGLSGNIKFELETADDTYSDSIPIDSSSRTGIGLRALYHLNDELGLGGDFASMSGEMKSTSETVDGGEETQTDKFSGSRIRFIIEYLF